MTGTLIFRTVVLFFQKKKKNPFYYLYLCASTLPAESLEIVNYMYVPSGSIDFGRQTVVVETRKWAMAVVNELVPRNDAVASWANNRYRRKRIDSPQ